MVATEQNLGLRIKRLPMLELIGFSLLITGLTLLAWWRWRTLWIEPVTTAASIEPLLSILLFDNTIIAMLAASEFLCTLALLMGVTPLGWWIEPKALPNKRKGVVIWLARRIRQVITTLQSAGVPLEPQTVTVGGLLQPQMQGEAGVGDPASLEQQYQTADAASDPSGTSQTAQQSEQSEQKQGAGSTGDTQASQAATPAPGAEAAQQNNGQQAAPQGDVQPPPTMPTAEELLDVDDEEEGDLLSDLTDVGSMLAAFQMEEEIDPWLASLSASLDTVEVDAIALQSDAILHSLRTGRRKMDENLAPLAEVGQPNREKRTPVALR